MVWRCVVVRHHYCGLLRYLYFQRWKRTWFNTRIDPAAYSFRGRHFGQRHVCWNCGIHRRCMPLRHTFSIFRSTRVSLRIV